MIKLTIFTFLLIFNVHSYANNLCSDWKVEITDRRDESLFSKKSYLSALEGLNFYASNGSVDPWPLFKRVEGYLLKQSALKELSEGRKSIGFSNYCDFIVQQGTHKG